MTRDWRICLGGLALGLAGLAGPVRADDVPCRAPAGGAADARWVVHLGHEAAAGFRGDVRVVQGDSTLFHGRYVGSSSDSTDGAFWIGSITKTFTAVTIVRLVEEGKLALDAPLGTYLADVPERWRRRKPTRRARGRATATAGA